MHFGTMARITFSLPQDIAEAAAAKAKSDRRSLSAYITHLVENDARNAGLLTGGAKPELMAAIEQIGETKALKVLRNAARR